MTAPALSSLPSMPSVSQASAWTPASPSSARASASRYSQLGPPRPPVCVSVTVVSPPETRTQGGFAGSPRWAAARARRACARATSRASPSTASPRMTGLTPALRATAVAAARASRAVAINTARLLARRRSPGLGVSSAPERRWSTTAAGSSSPYLSITASASAKVVASATVGPEAITAGSSPGTSEMRSVTTRAGVAAAASRPPLIAERCLRTELISAMVAPEAMSRAVAACLSASLRPGAGRLRSAEPPPDKRHRTRSPAVSPETISRMRAAAARPAASGTGWAASTTSIRRQGTP